MPLHLPSSLCSFEYLTRIAGALRQLEADELADALNRSHEILQPLGEPLKQEFALDRWLASAREEEYSDRLQWLIGRMTIAELASVLGLQYLGDDSFLILPPGEVISEREVWLPYEEGSGRIDILVRLSGRTFAPH
jgi:hypothetical protein